MTGSPGSPACSTKRSMKKSSKLWAERVELREEVELILLEDLKPKSVIDPFMGSGTTAEVCLKLGIPYCGYEKEIIYKQDIDKRIKRGIQFKGQTKLDLFTQKNV